MHLTTSLPFPHISFKHWDRDDTEVAVLVVKGTFGANEDGTWSAVEEQPPIEFVDAFWGEENASSLRSEQDIAPAKAGTDIIVNAVARAPEAQKRPDWPVSVEVVDRVSYQFHVRGPSEWRKERGRWTLSDPSPVTEVPIRYELAYGGSAPTDEEPEHYEFNPVGKGYVNDKLLNQGDPIEAPQIGDLADFMSGNIKENMTVHGLGPIAKSWLPRRSEAGTFDADWQNTRHPRMPEDYSYAFWNAAPKALQLKPYLKGGEHFILKGFQHDPKPIQFVLPPFGVVAQIDGQPVKLHLTDVHIDVADVEKTKHRIILMWRGIISNPSEIETIHIEAIANEEQSDE